jgi:hypothetical protein
LKKWKGASSGDRPRSMPRLAGYAVMQDSANDSRMSWLRAAPSYYRMRVVLYAFFLLLRALEHLNIP